MRDSVTLLEHSNLFNPTNDSNPFLHRIATKKNVDIYSSGQFLPTLRQTKQYRSDKITLPSLDKDEQRTRKTSKRPIYRTSLYHRDSAIVSHLSLTPLTGRGTHRETMKIFRDDDTVKNLQRHHAPPPSPSDDQLERIFSDLNRTRQSSPRSDLGTDGYVPYRLPALHQSTQGRSKDIRSTLSNYLHRY